jgi:putative SOS response-associated peptidase YedK
MPVILDEAGYSAWVGDTPAAGDELQPLLRLFPAERMTAHMIQREE